MIDDRPRPTAPYEWSWSLHPSVLIGTGILGALYFYGIGPLRRRYNLGPPASPWQILSFSAALVVLLFSLNGPVHDLSDYYLFSVHMFQHLVLTLLFPPLLLAGVPGWLFRPLLVRPGILPVARFLTRPWAAALIFSVSLAVWHVATYYDL
ncbi:MAG: cytochrome c oxidase assembly protein, partial [Acidimicrobiia bacterium]